MKYCKKRTSILQESSDGGATWTNVEGSEEEVIVRTYSSSTECENSIIGTVPSTSGGKKSAWITGTDTSSGTDCDSSSVYSGWGDIDNASYKTTILSLSIGDCVEEVTLASGWNHLVSLRNIYFPSTITLLGGAASNGGVGRGAYSNLNLANLMLPPNVSSLAWGSLPFHTYDSRYYEVVVPSSCQNSGQWSGGCSRNLKNIVLLNRPTELLLGFASGSKITEFEIPDSVATINAEAFKNCKELTALTIPNSVTSIGNDFLMGCTKLSGVTSLPSSVVGVGTNFMRYTPITSFTFSDNVTTIGSYAFKNCPNLKWVEFGSGLTTVGSSLFGDCYSLSYVVFKSPEPPANFSLGEPYLLIYVPDEYVTTWQLSLSTTSDYKQRIRPLSYLSS